MENKDVQRRSGSTRRTFLSASAATAVAAPIIAQSVTASAAPVAGAAGARSATILPPSNFDPALRALIRQIDPNRIQATIENLVSFGTRHTASSQTDPNRGIGAATAYVTQQMQSFADASNGRMTVQQQTFTQQPVPGRIPVPTQITNVIATIKGTASPERFYVITGHLDSRCTDVLDFTSDAPGADDDGSGVAVVLELARLFSSIDHQFPGTLVLATVDGEEQGLFGSAHMATAMNNAGNDVQAMFSNDIVGASKSFDGRPPDPHTLRLFVEGVPTNATPNDIQILTLTGGENDSKSRQLGRFVLDAAPFSLTNMNIRTIWRRDRYLRASDHVSFETFGYPAARFTEPRENFNHEHQNVRVENGVQFGDLIDFVDFDFIARVAAVNAATLWALATAPGTPKNLQIHTNPPPGLPGTNLTTLSWNANPESNLAKYEVVMRESTAADWTDVIDAGNVTTVTLDISKDNVQFGLRAVDSAGNRSPVAFPVVVG
ncbi:MAG TPA: M28 family metallopeptidase [Streptosporangiaceae bacterium]|jgi:hypothetical protein|nr:M28 family metallopeptidase [Streptosporangiaceae bacterium]